MRDISFFDERFNVQRGENVFTRICSGYIDSVDEINGTVIVNLEDFIGTRGSVTLSFDYFSASGPGWIRFMPSIGDKVLCGFHPSNEIEILRYKPLNYAQWAQFSRNANPAFVFRQLKSGEFEIMSSGFAEIWGSRTGVLHLAGGLASIDLSNVLNQTTHQASLHQLQGDGSEFHFGTVRRASLLKTTPDEYSIATVPQKEVYSSLVQSIAGVPVSLYSSQIGNVVDYALGVFAPRKAPDTGQNLVADINFYTLGGVQKTEVRIDQLGNARVDLPASAADGLRVVSSLGSLYLNFLNANFAATGQMSLSSTLSMNLSASAEMSLTAPLIKLANSTTSLGVLLQTLITDIGTLNTTLEAFMVALAALSAVPILSGAEVATPATLAGTSLVALTASLTALAAQVASLLQ